LVFQRGLYLSDIIIVLSIYTCIGFVVIVSDPIGVFTTVVSSIITTTTIIVVGLVTIVSVITVVVTAIVVSSLRVQYLICFARHFSTALYAISYGFIHSCEVACL